MRSPHVRAALGTVALFVAAGCSEQLIAPTPSQRPTAAAQAVGNDPRPSFLRDNNEKYGPGVPDAPGIVFLTQQTVPRLGTVRYGLAYTLTSTAGQKRLMRRDLRQSPRGHGTLTVGSAPPRGTFAECAIWSGRPPDATLAASVS